MRALIIALLLSLGLSFVPPASAVQLDSMDAAQASISEYYQQYFALMGLPYHDPTVIFPTKEKPYISEYCTGGQPVYQGFLAFYCPLDETIVLEKPEMDKLAKVDTFIPMFILSHEWGHHIQNLEGLDTPAASCGSLFCSQAPIDPGDWDIVYSIELEQMADCLGGSWMAYLEGRYELNDSDISNLLVFMVKVLDGGSVSKGPQAHGDANQRIDATLRGFHHGLVGCMSLHPTDAIPTPTPSSSGPH